MAYSQKNSKGTNYFLHSKQVTLRGGRPQTIYYFAKAEKKPDSIDAIPNGYEVSENKRTGLLFLRKKK